MKTIPPFIAKKVGQVAANLKNEASCAKMIGDDEHAQLFTMVSNTLQQDVQTMLAGECSFHVVLQCLNGTNELAQKLESLTGDAEPDEKTVLLRTAYAIRQAAEESATKLWVVIAIDVPLFEVSLAKLRFSCAILASLLGDCQAALHYANGVMRLSAPEEIRKLVQRFMQSVGGT